MIKTTPAHRANEIESPIDLVIEARCLAAIDYLLESMYESSISWATIQDMASDPEECEMHGFTQDAISDAVYRISFLRGEI